MRNLCFLPLLASVPLHSVWGQTGGPERASVRTSAAYHCGGVSGDTSLIDDFRRLKVAHKTGEITSVARDVAIVAPPDGGSSLW
jgi:hypothetical protein